MDTENHVADLTAGQLAELSGELRRAAERLDDFRRGDDTAWTLPEIVSLYETVTFAGSQVGIIRRLRAADARQADVIHLPRTPLSAP